MQNSKFQIQNSGESGLTLIEILAAISIFSAIIVVIVSILISVTTSQRRSSKGINIDNAVYFAMESMAKEIRTGKDFYCYDPLNDSSSDIQGCKTIAFTNYHGDEVLYELSGSQIKKICNTNISGDCAEGFVTPSDINATVLNFDLRGIIEPDSLQSRITIVINAETPSGTPEALKRDIKLQTTVSSRNSDS